MASRLNYSGGVGLSLASAASALALPPSAPAQVSDWSNQWAGTVPEFDLEIFASATRALTDVSLYAARLHTQAIANKTVTASSSTDELAASSHGLLTGDGPLKIDSSGSVPGGLVATVKSALDLGTVTANIDTVIQAKDPAAGEDGDAITVVIVGGAGSAAGTLSEDTTTQVVTITIKTTATATTVSDLETLIGTSTLIEVKTAGTGATSLTTDDLLASTALAGGVTGDDYYVIEGSDSGHLKLATSRENALANSYIDLTSNGSGTITLADTADTERVHWSLAGLLGVAEDGAISLTNQKAYMVRCKHSPRVIAYAITATFGAGTGTISARVYPVTDF